MWLIRNFFLNSNYQLQGLFYHKQLTRGQQKYFDVNNIHLKAIKFISYKSYVKMW